MNAKTNSNSASDDRLRRDASPTTRGDRGIVEDAARANETGLSNDMSELQSLLASEFEQVALPTPPLIPGWHTCWLTTTSNYDTIQKRQRLGYQPVLESEVSGFHVAGAATAAFPGAITCNEMVLFKISQARYQMIMTEFHHKRPLQEEENIYAAAEALQKASGQDKKGNPLGAAEGDGFSQIGANIEQARRAQPQFA